jgi:hypothetical protein
VAQQGGAWRSAARPGSARQGWHGVAKRGLARLGKAQRGKAGKVGPSVDRQGRAGQSMAEHGKAGVVGSSIAGHGEAWRGAALRSAAWPVPARQGWLGKAWHGAAWQGHAWPGRARLGKASKSRGRPSGRPLPYQPKESEMARKPTKAKEVEQQAEEQIKLSALLSKKPIYSEFAFWIVGDTPLITHAWSEKAKREMLIKQVKATKPGKEARDPQADFVSSLYEMNGGFGFPATGVKNCILSAAHKDKGIARASVMAALWLHAEMVRTRPALAGAICDMPLIKVHGPKPEMREDMVKIGSGLSKTANLAYRGQFTVWAMRITGRFNTAVLTAEALAFIVQESGIAAGLGEWRNERKGMFGAFHLADANEEDAWEAFAAGKGPMPVPASYQFAAE